jgi:hypothetical protein
MSAPERVKGEEKENLVGPYLGRKKVFSLRCRWSLF